MFLLLCQAYAMATCGCPTPVPPPGGARSTPLGTPLDSTPPLSSVHSGTDSQGYHRQLAPCDVCLDSNKFVNDTNRPVPPQYLPGVPPKTCGEVYDEAAIDDSGFPGNCFYLQVSWTMMPMLLMMTVMILVMMTVMTQFSSILHLHASSC